MDLATLLHPVIDVESRNQVRWPPTSSPPHTSDGLTEDRGNTLVESPIFTPSTDSADDDLDERTVSTYLENYFRYGNKMYYFIPRAPFMAWFGTCAEKLELDILVVKAMLAYGCLFANTPESKSHMRELLRQITSPATDIPDHVISLQTVMVRLVLAMLYYAMNNRARGRDFGGWSFRGSCILGLFTEEGISNVPKNGTLFDFPVDLLHECRRRVFWAGYIMECLGTIDMPSLSTYSGANCRLRLPCHDLEYEQGVMSRTPVFANSTSLIATITSEEHSGAGAMAYLVEIASIWGDVNAWAYQQPLQPTAQEVTNFRQHYKLTTSRLDAWLTAYKNFLRKQQTHGWENTPKVPQDLITSFHFLYRIVAMRLNRHIFTSYLTEDHVTCVVKTAFEHAHETLKQAQNFSAQAGRDSPELVGFSIMLAVDVATSTGRLQGLLDTDSKLVSLLAGAISVVEDLAQQWPGVEEQRKIIGDRFQKLLRASLSTNQGKTAYWMKDPMDSTFGLDKDVIYNTPRHQVMQAIGHEHDILNDEDFLAVF